MPRLPHLSGAEIVRALESLGFAQLRQSGSHVIMRKGEVGTVVPLHREVRIGTLSGILRQAQVPADDFLAALK